MAPGVPEHNLIPTRFESFRRFFPKRQEVGRPLAALDTYCGTAGITRAMEAKDFNCEGFDILVSLSMDSSRPAGQEIWASQCARLQPGGLGWFAHPCNWWGDFPNQQHHAAQEWFPKGRFE